MTEAVIPLNIKAIMTYRIKIVNLKNTTVYSIVFVHTISPEFAEHFLVGSLRRRTRLAQAVPEHKMPTAPDLVDQLFGGFDTSERGFDETCNHFCSSDLHRSKQQQTTSVCSSVYSVNGFRDFAESDEHMDRNRIDMEAILLLNFKGFQKEP
ncbi:hypothetical protein NECAME_04562 [Necator americanus]|uniref:Uncharacterized protein n=1 Tax=Necator americanus TaxID=51031 RepID=W2SQR0_NECAM|nr:hypothetical protein NECAME_04562 [Necator americanus]ETN71818.1 hypothetical protein NECAME_04562 [Necator americanus]